MENVEDTHGEKAVAHYTQAMTFRQRGFLVQNIGDREGHEPAETLDKEMGQMLVPAPLRKNEEVKIKSNGKG